MRASVWVEPSTATLGDVLTFRLRLEVDPGATVRIGAGTTPPGTAAGGGAPRDLVAVDGLPVIDSGIEVSTVDGWKVGGPRREESWWKLRAEELGSFILPALLVRWEAEEPGSGEAGPSGQLRTEEVFVEVVSVLPAEGRLADIRDIKPLREPGLTVPPWLLLLSGGFLALALLSAFLFTRRRRHAFTPVSPPSAGSLALEALGRLPLPAADEPEAVRSFAFRLSEIVRAYVEARFDLNATDLTTEEILPALRGLGPLSAEAESLLTRLLCWTDRVKFAEHVGSLQAEEPTLRTTEARRLIAATHVEVEG